MILLDRLALQVQGQEAGGWMGVFRFPPLNIWITDEQSQDFHMGAGDQMWARGLTQQAP